MKVGCPNGYWNPAKPVIWPRRRHKLRKRRLSTSRASTTSAKIRDLTERLPVWWSVSLRAGLNWLSATTGLCSHSWFNHNVDKGANPSSTERPSAWEYWHAASNIFKFAQRRALHSELILRHALLQQALINDSKYLGTVNEGDGTEFYHVRGPKWPTWLCRISNCGLWGCV